MLFGASAIRLRLGKRRSYRIPAELPDNVRTIPQETLTPRQAVLAGLARALDRDPNLGLDAWGEWTERRRRGGAGGTSGA
jgi:hypothetical protein